MGLGSSTSSNSIMSMTMSTDVFYEMPEKASLYEGQYDVKAGRWPKDLPGMCACAHAEWKYQ